MTRILADLPVDDIKWLEARASEQGKSRASVLREIVAWYRRTMEFETYFGLWQRHGSTVDGLEYERLLEDGL